MPKPNGKVTEPEGEETENSEELETEEEAEAEDAGESTPDPEEVAKKKVAKASKKAGVKLKPENIIGEIPPPDDPSDREEVIGYYKKVDRKLDHVIELLKKPNKKEKVETPPEPIKKKELPWYDREFI